MNSEEPENLVFFYHPDHLGSTSYVTDADGNIAQHVEYIPYGEIFVEERNSQFSTNFLFNAKELDNETGLFSLEGNKLVINYFSDANFFHESTHASQYYRGDLVFFKSSGNPFCYDIYDELSAYIMENAYSGMNNLSAINIDRIYNMSYFDGQQSHFIYKHLPKFSLGKNGSSYFLRIAYPQENEGSINKTIEDYVGDFVNFHK